MSSTPENLERPMLDVLVIDDDPVARKIVSRDLKDEPIKLRFGVNGESGLKSAFEKTPDIILLDVEMPDINGYEVCSQLRSDPLTVHVPIIFVSSHSTQRERMLGYEVGGNDYLVKPFNNADLIVKIRVMARYRDEQKELRKQYDIAQQTAFAAMTVSSELGLVMQYVEKSYSLGSFNELSEGLFDVTDKLGINCSLMVINEDDNLWFASDGSLSPLEKELIINSDRASRFVDFGKRTIINYSHTSIFVRDMPLDNIERYGVIKDLLPAMLAVVNAKVNSLTSELTLEKQNQALIKSFSGIKSSTYYLAKDIINNQEKSEKLLADMINELTFDFLKMGLEEDQEAYIVERLESSVNEAMQQMDARSMLYTTLSTILSNIKDIVQRQQCVMQVFEEMHTQLESSVSDDFDDGIELF
ncbi:MAG: response regulator [Gammaproteobacteria bacterium]|nr:response regulator [Gammaproteobacteria bacterium]